MAASTLRPGKSEGRDSEPMKQILFVLMVVAVLAGCSENPAAPKGQYDVTYRVDVAGSSTGWLTFVIFMDECGELQSVDPPYSHWQYDFRPETVPSGTYLYLSAQGDGDVGCYLRAEIWIDGEVWKSMEGGMEDVLIVFGTLP